jgi:hypothetical protein
MGGINTLILVLRGSYVLTLTNMEHAFFSCYSELLDHASAPNSLS